jgi:hypothetical protein
MERGMGAEKTNVGDSIEVGGTIHIYQV